MKELNVCTCEKTEMGAVYRYSVLVGEMQVSPYFACESYGIKISDVAGGEVAVVADITPNIAKIDALMTMLVKNAVAPEDLKNVVSDWLE